MKTMIPYRRRLKNIFQRIAENVYHEPLAEAAEEALLKIASDPEVNRLTAGTEDMAGHMRQAGQCGDLSVRENALIALYHHLHGAGAFYRSCEEDLLSERQGLKCIPGGLMPLFMAGVFIGPQTVTADLGAGNGLQGLLMQFIRPHKKTRMVEICENLVEKGRLYQQALGVEPDRINWECADIAETELEDVDLVYMYRPARPMGEGKLVYRAVAEKLEKAGRPVTVISVADCMGRFLPESFRSIYSNEFVEIYCLPGSF